ncbi:hypothetical protein Noda2021_09720 [Candidatus Dependentiae bacterium Noda2021]|nr:hypothetical protein Noda2021_09720 [Candidatus Dependentiae bacterium Noda2021]
MKLKILSLLTMLTLSMAQPANSMETLKKYFATANRLKQNATSYLLSTAMSFAGWFGGNSISINGSHSSLNGIVVNGKRIQINSTDQNPVTKTIYKTIDLPANGVLIVNNDKGNVSLISSGRSNTIEVIATVTAPNEDEAKNLVPKLWDSETGTVRLETEYLNNATQGSIAYNIKVPQKTLQKNIQTSNGSIELRNGIGDMYTKTSNGNVSIINAHGSIHNTTSSGHTSYEAIVGSVVSNTSSGDQKLKNITGNIELKSNSGSLIASNISGAAQLKTSHGDITLQNGGNKVEASTSNGTVTLENIKGCVKTDSINGNHHLKNISNSATVTTTNGNTYLQNVLGKLLLTSKTGETTVTLEEPKQSITIKGGQGNVQLNVKSLQDAYLKITSRKGSLTSDWAIDRINNRVGFSVDQKLGSGQTTIEIATQTGNVYLKNK